MPIISRIEARSPRGRLLYAMIFLLLSLGGLAMIYPFAIMVSGSFRSEMDENELNLLPSYFVETDSLYRKFLETKYNQDVIALNESRTAPSFHFQGVPIPDIVNMRQVNDFKQFLAESEIPLHWQALGGATGIRTVPENLYILRNRLERHYNGDLAAFVRDVGAPVTSWSSITMRPPKWLDPRFDFQPNSLFNTYFALLTEAPWPNRQLVSLHGYFLESMIYPVYGQTEVDAYNRRHVRQIVSYADLEIPARVPGVEEPQFRKEWIDFVHNELNPAFILLDGVPAEDFQRFLLTQHGSLSNISRDWGVVFGSLSEITLPAGEWLRGTKRRDYQEFVAAKPPETYRLVGPDFAWREWLLARHGSIQEINRAYGAAYGSVNAIRLPVDQLEYLHVAENRDSLRRTYASRNFINVGSEIFLRGRAFLNTAIFCTLAVVSALLINPMAAYAMSRYRLPGNYKFLLLLMATISFPPMVTTIPQFIMLRELNLLNTFVALVLPAMANGYLIFLLKGFFDSLPRELYESATIDGASEIRIFFQITLSLSKPILAVVALGAFNGAYSAFLYPLIVAPRQDMWVLNVWLYQWQQTASSGGMFASVLIASIPTMVVFLIAQNVIMRGIVVPTEK